MKAVSTGQVFSRSSSSLSRGFLSTFFSDVFFLLSFISSLLGFEPAQNPRCLASVPNGTQALDVSLPKFSERGEFVQI